MRVEANLLFGQMTALACSNGGLEAILFTGADASHSRRWLQSTLLT